VDGDVVVVVVVGDEVVPVVIETWFPNGVEGVAGS
jgi:hypothetical protein